MISSVRRFLPDSIAGQIIVLVALSVLAANLVVISSFTLLQALTPESPIERTGMIVGFADLVDRTPVNERPALIDRFSAGNPQAAARLLPAPASIDIRVDQQQPADGPFLEALNRHFTAWRDGTEAGRFIIRLTDGSQLAINEPPPGQLMPFMPVMATFVLFALSVALFGIWAARSVASPLIRFARAVEALGGNNLGQDLPEEGPREVRSSIAAVNRLRRRINRLVDDNRQALAAISHDLRTPITRLRLRAELIEDASIRDPLLADIVHMSALTTGALAFLRDQSPSDEKTLVDLPSLLQTLCDHYADIGSPIGYVGPPRLAVRVRPHDIQRAMTNLIDNAIRYASVVTLSLSGESREGVEICVIDDGPGIAAEDRDRLQQPFVRGDDARDPDKSDGFGLGLSIVAAIAGAHGGEFRLDANQPTGLRASLLLPGSG